MEGVNPKDAESKTTAKDKNKPKTSTETAKEEDQKMDIVNPKDVETAAKNNNKPKGVKKYRDEK